MAEILLTPGAARDRLTTGAYVPRDEKDVVGRLEFAMEATIKADPIEARVRTAVKEGKLPQRQLAERRRGRRGPGDHHAGRSRTTSTTPIACAVK